MPKAMPFIKQGIRAIGRTLRETDPTKQAVKTLPVIAAKTVKSLTKTGQSRQTAHQGSGCRQRWQAGQSTAFFATKGGQGDQAQCVAAKKAVRNPALSPS
ncbi:MAG: hypothetical protein R2867_22930 [Caldilineaceae bacterium]